MTESSSARVRQYQSSTAFQAAKHPGRPVRHGARLSDPDFIRAAFRSAGRTRGKNTPGVDGVTWAQLDEGSTVSALAEQLRLETYRPDGLRRVTVKKASGGTRRIGIPTVYDRVASHALRQLLAPAIDARLSSNTFCRAGMGPQRAARAILNALTKCRTGYFIRCDVKNFFDAIPHASLMTMLRARFRGGALFRVLQLVLLKWQSASGRGLPQGGPLSPVLANFFLDSVDKHFEGNDDVVLFRYVDDILLLVRGGKEAAEKKFQKLQGAIAELGLSMNEKLVISEVHDGVDFLGMNFRLDSDDTPKVEVTSSSAAELRKHIAPSYGENTRQAGQRATSKNKNLHAVATAWATLQGLDGPVGNREMLTSLQATIGGRSERNSAQGTKQPQGNPLGDNSGDTHGMPRSEGGVQPHPFFGQTVHPPSTDVTAFGKAPELDEGALRTLSLQSLGTKRDEAEAWRDSFGARLYCHQESLRAVRSGRRDLVRTWEAGERTEIVEEAIRLLLQEEQQLVAEIQLFIDRTATMKRRVRAIEAEMRLRTAATGLNLPLGLPVHEVRVHLSFPRRPRRERMGEVSV